MQKLYDLTVLLDPDAPEERRSEILGNVESTIQASGTLVGHHDWGVRRIAFEINHRPEAAYHLYQFETDSNELLDRLGHNLKITDGVLRHRIIKLRPGTPDPPDLRPSAQPAVETEAEPAEA